MAGVTIGQTIGAPIVAGGPWRALGRVERIDPDGWVVIRSAQYPTCCLCVRAEALVGYGEEPPAPPPATRRPATQQAGGDWLDW